MSAPDAAPTQKEARTAEGPRTSDESRSESGASAGAQPPHWNAFAFVVGLILLALGAAAVTALWPLDRPTEKSLILAGVLVTVALLIGLERAGVLMVAGGMFFAPLSALQPLIPPPLITYADVFLLTGFALLLPHILRRPLKAPALFLVGSGIVLSCALLAVAVHPDVGQSLSSTLRIAYAVIALPLAFLWWSPSSGRVTLLGSAYVLGCLYSLAYGLADGPIEGGRYLGLTTHPNALGITLALGLSLVPYLASRMGDFGWLAYVGAAFGAYGVYVSGSRAALITVVLLVVMHLVIERTSGAFVLLLLVLAGVAAAAAAHLTSEGNALGRLFGATDSSDSDAQRGALLEMGLEQMRENPLLGGGFGYIRSAHNIYVQVGASMGLVALVGFLMILLALLMPLRTAPSPLHRLAYPALAYVLVGPLTDTLTDTSLWAAVALALLAASSAGTKDSRCGSLSAEDRAVTPSLDAAFRSGSQGTDEAPRRA